jgi:hypothetical protein
MPLNFFETVNYKLRALTGKNPGREIGSGFRALAEDIDSRMIAQRPRIVTTSETAEYGQLIVAKKMGLTVTLPEPGAAEGASIGVWALGGGPAKTITVKAGGNIIYGAGSTGVETITLAVGQHVLLQAVGVSWLIVAGEPMLAGAYGAKEARTPGTAYEPSATQQTFVVLSIRAENINSFIQCGEFIAEFSAPAGASVTIPFGFICPAGASWKVPASGVSELHSTYLPL